MDKSGVRDVMREARNCAMVMLESAAYIRGELPNVGMNDALVAQTEQVCAALISTKYDIMSELFELDQLLGSKVSTAVIASRVNRIVRWLRDDSIKMHELVVALEATSKQDSAYELSYVLVAESATSVLKAFDRTRKAADSLNIEADKG